MEAHGKTVSFHPAVNGLLTYAGNGRGKRVLIVGSGCAGLGAAWHLNRAGWEVTLKEADSRFGGHANTITVDGIEVDTGFMVYNALNYPNLMALFEELGIEGLDTEMGFSVSLDDGKFEWCGDSLHGLMATPSNGYNPAFYRMMRDILRFNTEALKALSLPENHPTRTQTVGEFIVAHQLSDSFTNLYLVPMTAAIWSSTARGILDFPAITLFSFLNNHLLLQVSGHLHWKTPAKRSREYVNAIVNELGSRAQSNARVQSIQRGVKDKKTGKETVVVTDDQGQESVYDSIVFACHPDQALNILGSNATKEEKEALGCFHYFINDTYVHTDVNLMPKSKHAWTSWNYLGNSVPANENQKPVYVTYWLNKLQKLNHKRDIFVSLNPHTPPSSTHTLSRIQYSHPQYTATSVQAQKRVVLLQGHQGTYYCGAWMGYGFHEDGLRTGLEVAVAICGKPLPWVQRFGQTAMIPAPTMTLSQFQNHSLFSGLFQWVTKPILWALQTSCRYLLLTFLKRGFSRGKLTFVLEDGSKVSFVGKTGIEEEEIVVRVFKSWFWVRVALEADLGLARSYIAGEWEVENTGPYSDGLTKVLLNLIDNMPNGKTHVTGGIDAAKLASATVGTALNWVWYRLTMDNSIANSRSNIHAHYDLSNSLFATFLDTKHMMYSSAIFDTRLVPTSSVTVGGKSTVSLEFHGTLEDAQTRKIDALLARLEPLDAQHTLLDIGFGWGGVCIRAAEKYGCKVHGITLSVEQKELAEQLVQEKGLGGLVTFELVDYRVFAARGVKFDRIVSCEMIEAVGHNHLAEFFRGVEQLLHTEGIFVMQAITMPDARYPVYHKSADFLNTIIFPGGCCPSLSALLTAMANESTLHLENVVNTNLHYAETLRQWRVRFNQAMPKVLSLGFDDSFIRLWNLYLAYCEAGFKAQIINLQILTFSRPGNPNMIVTRGTQFACPHAYLLSSKQLSAMVSDGQP